MTKYEKLTELIKEGLGGKLLKSTGEYIAPILAMHLLENWTMIAGVEEEAE